MLFNLLLGVLGLYVVSRLYSSVTGKHPADNFKIHDVKDAFKKNSGVWWFMVPVSGLLVMLYDAVISVIWLFGELIKLITEVVKWIISVIKWIYIHVIIGGYWFLMKLIWHYFILIPWRLCRDAFTLMNQAIKWNNYKIAVKAIFFGLLLAFIGRYVNTFISDESMGMKSVIEQISILLSILPVGMGASIIIYNRKNADNPGSWKVEGLKFAKLALAILLPVFSLFAVEYILINLGSRTSFQFTLSTLLAGGSLVASALILINAVLVIFILSALPSFSNDYKGTLKGVYKAFFSHIYKGWATYMLAVPAIVIPAFILSIIPGLLTQGTAYMTQQVSNHVYDQRINSLNESANKEALAYANWCNVDSISNDSLAKLIAQDKDLLSDKLALADLKKGKNYIDTSYSKFANRNGAVTVGLMYFLYDQYKAILNDNMKVVALDTHAEIDSSYSELAEEMQMNIVECDTAIAQYNRNIAYYETQRALVCATVTTPTNESSVVTEQPVQDAPQVVTVDACEQQRLNFDSEIAKLNESKNNTIASKDRLTAVKSHLNEMQTEAASSVGHESIAKHIGYLFMGLWLCVLAAIALGYVLSMFAHMNAYVYDSMDDSEWLVVSEIKSAHAQNKNQPLLGLILTAVTSVMLFGYVQSIKPELWEKAKTMTVDCMSKCPWLSSGKSNNTNVAVANDSIQSLETKQVEVEVIIKQDSIQPADSTTLIIVDAPSAEYYYYD